MTWLKLRFLVAGLVLLTLPHCYCGAGGPPKPPQSTPRVALDIDQWAKETQR